MSCSVLTLVCDRRLLLLALALQHTRRPDASQPQKTRIDWRGDRTDRDEARVIRQQRGFSGHGLARPSLRRPGLTARIAAARGDRRGRDGGASARGASRRRPVAARPPPRPARPGARALDRDGRAPAARNDPQGARAKARKGHAAAKRRAGMDARRRRRPASLPGDAGSRRGRPRRAGGAGRSRQRSLRRARQRGPAGRRARSRRRSSPPRIRSTTTRRRGSPRAGARPTATTTARAIAAAHRCEPTLDLSVKSDPQRWAERLGGIVLPTGSVRLDSHRPIAELEGYADGEWWVQDAAAALPARLLGARAGQRVVDLCAAPGGKSAELAVGRRRGHDGRPVGRTAEGPRRQFRAAEAARRHRRGRRRSPSTRRRSTRRSSTRPARPPAPSGATRTSPGSNARPIFPASSSCRPAARQGGRADEAGRPDRLLHLLARARGGRGPDRRAAAAQPGRPPGADRRGRDRRALAQCVTPAGDLRTLPCHLWGDDPRRSGLDGFFAARLVKTG